MTLNDLERRNGPVVCVILPNSVALGPHYVKVVEDNNNNNNPICKAPECQKTSVALADRNSGQEQSCELNRIKSPTE